MRRQLEIRQGHGGRLGEIHWLLHVLQCLSGRGKCPWSEEDRCTVESPFQWFTSESMI